MHYISLILILFATSLSVLPLLEDAFEIPIQYYTVQKDILKQKQLKRLDKLGLNLSEIRMYHPKLLEAPYKDDYLTTKISFGNPPQNFTPMVSSGATRLWVLDRYYDAKTPHQNTYYPERSSTSKNLQKQFWYADGTYNATGDYFQDKFRFINSPHFFRQEFGAIRYIEDWSDSFDFPVDGLLGLSHLGPNAYEEDGEYPALIDRLLKPLIRRIVTVFLDRHIAPRSGKPTGKITLGGFDKSNCENPLFSVPIPLYIPSSTGVNLYGTQVLGVQFGTFSVTSNVYFGLFDTGFSSIQMPASDLLAIFNIILPSYDWTTGFYTLKCTDAINQDYLEFVFWNGVEYKVYPRSYIVDLNLDDNQCAIALEGINAEMYQTVTHIFGTPFYREYCITTDLDMNVVFIYNHRS